jgi:PKD domain-containing protein
MGMNRRIWSACAAVVTLAVPATAQAAPTWLAPETAAPIGSSATAAMGAGGDVAIGYRTTSGTAQAQGVFRTPAGPFGAPSPLSNIGDGGTLAARVAVNARGDAVAGWTNTTNIYMSTRPSGGSWSAPITIGPTGGTFGNDDPQVGIADDGTTAIAWNFYTGSKFAAHYAIRSASGVLGPIKSSDTAQSITGVPQLAMNGAGDIIVAWPRTNGTKYVLQAAVRPRGGDFSAPIDLSDSAQDASLPAVALAQNGASAVAWTRSDGTNPLTQVSRRPAGGAFGLAETLSAAGADATFPAVSINDAGETLVSWTRAGSAQARIGGLTGSFQPLTDFGTGGGRTSAVIDNDGLAVVSFGATSQAFASVRQPGGAFGTPERLSPDGVTVFAYSNVPTAPLGTDGQGNAVAAWDAFGGGVQSIGARILDGGAPAFGAVSTPTTATAGQAATFSATATDRFSPIASTTWDFGDGSAAATGASVQHTFAAAGAYDVKVTATDSAGNAASATRRVTVAAAAGAPAPPAPPIVKPALVKCKVPSLKNLTVTRAKSKLKSAHCALGKVTTPRKLKHKRGLVIRSQSRKAGTSTTSGAKVNVTLGTKPKAKKKAKKK